MSARNKLTSLLIASFSMLCASNPTIAAKNDKSKPATTEHHLTLAEQLGWVNSNDNNCGGYYLEQAFRYPGKADKKKSIGITGKQAFYSRSGMTTLEGSVSLTRFGQQITANKAFLFRNKKTKKFSSLDLLGNVHLREPNTLVVAKKGHYNFETNYKSLKDILYRTTMLEGKEFAGPKVSKTEMQQQRKVTATTAWGHADEFSQAEPRVYELHGATYSTCPPNSPAWRVKASNIVLNKNTGRGHATNARIFVRNIPVFYWPYLNFSIDKRRKTGFLWPTVGVSNKWGPYVVAPFYWNIAPNYDMTITTGVLLKRGVQLSDKFRYLTRLGNGQFTISVLPDDNMFGDFQNASREIYANSTNPVIQSELNRLLNSSTTRKSVSWYDDTRFNEHWSSHIDFNYAGDDYYLRDFGSNLNEITQNQLLQEADLYYKGKNWNFIGRVQTYQTLHPIDEPLVQNQYRRFPQLILNGDYPDQKFGLDFFVKSEATHFDIRNTPGATTNLPIGNRFYLQPGVSLPLYRPYFFVNPRVQLSLTKYNLYQTASSGTPNSIQRAIPIFDVAMGAALDRKMKLFGRAYQQTLEPQLYYTYIPYRNQSSIPIFDTTVNTLTYDQIFNYNRFSGLDRIGDANQMGIGITTRLIERETGLERVRAGVGEILYFSNRRVTFCNNSTCTDNPFNPANHWRLSPVSAFINYAVSSRWKLDTNAIWNPISKQLSNATAALQYRPDPIHLVNLGYSYVFNGDPLSGASVNNGANNLKLTDFSFSWPVREDLSVVGRWSHNWNQQHLQNLIYGLQYDTCCWAVRMVGGRAFTNLDPTKNNSPQYNSEFYIQFALKGLGNVGSGNPNGLLSTISGYDTHFGQEF